MTEFGTSRSGIDKIFSTSDSHVSSASGRGPMNIPQKAHNLQVRQTQGDELRTLCKHIKDFFDANLQLESLPGLRLTVPPVEAALDRRTVSLRAWTTELFINAGQRAYFGDALAAIDPDLPVALVELDSLSWQVFYQYPRLLRPRIERLSARIRRSLEAYFELSRSQRPVQAWFTQALEQEYRQAGLDSKDIGAQMLFLYWG